MSSRAASRPSVSCTPTRCAPSASTHGSARSGEYCPGAQSINARGAVKLVGTGQRVVRNAWLFSTLTVIGDDELIRSLLTEVYAHLELPLDPATVGSLSTERPDLTAAAVEHHFHATYAAGITPSPLDAPTLQLAASIAADHRT